jgi:hypothetical protein
MVQDTGSFVDISPIAAVDEVIDLLGRAIVTDCCHPSTVDNTEARAQPTLF